MNRQPVSTHQHQFVYSVNVYAVYTYPVSMYHHSSGHSLNRYLYQLGHFANRKWYQNKYLVSKY